MSYKHLVCKLGLCALVMGIFVVKDTSAQAQYEYQDEGLNEHNRLRAMHGAPAMTLDAELNEIALKCAEYVANLGRLEHTCPYKTKNVHGENLSAATGNDYSEAVTNAIQRWYDEVRDYNFNNPSFTLKTGHFSQLVWSSSTRLGIGAFYKDGLMWVAAIYTPAGNFPGGFESNVLRRQ